MAAPSISSAWMAGNLTSEAVRAALVTAVASAESAEAAVDAVVGTLTSGEFGDRLAEAAAEAQGLAWAAWNLRDDLYDNPQTPDMAARIVLAAVAEAAGCALPPCAVTRTEAEVVVGSIAYRDWEFGVDEGPLGLRVKVVATVGDSRKADGRFTLSRSADIHGKDVAGAALSAVLQVERHETMERFFVDGERVFDPHSAPQRFVAEAVIRKR